MAFINKLKAKEKYHNWLSKAINSNIACNKYNICNEVEVRSTCGNA